MQEVSKRGVWSTNLDKKQLSTVGCGSGGSNGGGGGSYTFSSHHHNNACGHPTGGSQKSLVVNQNGKKPLMKEVTVWKHDSRTSRLKQQSAMPSRVQQPVCKTSLIYTFQALKIEFYRINCSHYTQAVTIIIIICTPCARACCQNYKVEHWNRWISKFNYKIKTSSKLIINIKYIIYIYNMYIFFLKKKLPFLFNFLREISISWRQGVGTGAISTRF